jgi:hypothetical protein
MTKKMPTDAQVTGMVRKDIERTLTLTDTINGKKPLGGTLGKKAKPINTTPDFDQFIKDVDFLIRNYTKAGKSAQFSIQRMKGTVADLRKKK